MDQKLARNLDAIAPIRRSSSRRGVTPDGAIRHCGLPVLAVFLVGYAQCARAGAAVVGYLSVVIG